MLLPHGNGSCIEEAALDKVFRELQCLRTLQESLSVDLSAGQRALERRLGMLLRHTQPLSPTTPKAVGLHDEVEDQVEAAQLLREHWRLDERDAPPQVPPKAPPIGEGHPPTPSIRHNSLIDTEPLHLPGPPSPLLQNSDTAAKEHHHSVRQSRPSNKVGREIKDTLFEELKHTDLGKDLASSKDKTSSLRQTVRWTPSISNGPPTFIQRCVAHPMFDLTFSILIAASTILMGAELNYKGSYGSGHSMFRIFSHLFNLLFLIECGLRMIAQRWFFFTGKDRIWNGLDFSLVAVSLYEFIIDVSFADGAEQSIGGTGLVVVRVLRNVRTVRLLRLVRIMRFSPEMRLILFMLVESMRSLCFVLCFIVILLFVFALFFTQAAVEYLQPGILEGDLSGLAQGKNLRWYFGSTWRSGWSLFACITGGLDWGVLGPPLSALPPIYSGIFLFYIAFGTFALLNIITGAFVDGALQKSQNERAIVAERELAAQKMCTESLRTMFQEVASHDKGELTVEMFVTHLKQNPKVRAWFQRLQIDISDAEKLFNMLDTDDSGTVDIDEFVSSVLELKGQATTMDIKSLSCECRKLYHKVDSCILAFSTTDASSRPSGGPAWKQS